MSTENSKASNPHILLLNFSDKINSKRSEVINMFLYQILSFAIHGNK